MPGDRRWLYDGYAEYVEAQIRANHDKLNRVWVRRDDITFLSDYLLFNLPSEHLDLGICHGTRRGQEQAWFMEELPCPVIGTEISDTANQFPHTTQWDFHNIKEEWIGAADFVYSNSFDHSALPVQALDVWARQLKPGGICLIEHSPDHMPDKVSETDPFGFTLERLIEMVNRAGAFRELLERDGRAWVAWHGAGSVAQT